MTCNATIPQNPCPSQSTGLNPQSMSTKFTDPNRARSCLRPMAPTNGGMIIGTSKSPPRSALPRNSYRVITEASGRVSNVGGRRGDQGDGKAVPKRLPLERTAQQKPGNIPG